MMIRWEQKSWFTPPVLFSLVCTLLIGFSVILAPGFYYSPKALLFIFSIDLVFYAGTFITGHFCKKSTIEIRNRNNAIQNLTRKEAFLSFVIIGGALAGLFAVILLLAKYRQLFSSQFSLKEYISLAHKMSRDRYDGIRLPMSIMFCNSMAYVACLTGGFLLAITRKKSLKFFSIMPLLTFALFTLLYTARAVFLYSVIIFLSSYISSKLLCNGYHFKLFTRRNLITGSIIFIFISALSVITQLGRENLSNLSMQGMEEVTSHLKISSLGNISGFSVWFDKILENPYTEMGKYTFGGIFELISDYHRELGVFPDFVFIGPYGEATNIFTVFRFFLEDGSFLTIYAIIFVAGCTSEYCIHRLIRRDIRVLPLFCIIYSFILWSFIGSVFINNSIIFAFVIFTGIIYYMATDRLTSGKSNEKRSA